MRSWTKADGLGVLVQGPWDIAGLALGESHIVWTGVHGPMTLYGIYESAELYWSPAATTPSGIAITQGPDLTGKLSAEVPMATAGDYVALSTGGDPETPTGPGTIVVQLSTEKQWFIPARPGTRMFLAGMSESEILVMESDQDPSYFLRWLRFDIAELDSLAVGWGEP